MEAIQVLGTSSKNMGVSGTGNSISRLAMGSSSNASSEFESHVMSFDTGPPIVGFTLETSAK